MWELSASKTWVGDLGMVLSRPFDSTDLFDHPFDSTDPLNLTF